jgi:hypothetical protein
VKKLEDVSFANFLMQSDWRPEHKQTSGRRQRKKRTDAAASEDATPDSSMIQKAEYNSQESRKALEVVGLVRCGLSWCVGDPQVNSPLKKFRLSLSLSRVSEFRSRLAT